MTTEGIEEAVPRVLFIPHFYGPSNSYRHVVWADNYSRWSLSAHYNSRGIPYLIEDRLWHHYLKYSVLRTEGRRLQKFRTTRVRHSREVRDPHVGDRLHREVVLASTYSAPWSRKRT